FALPPRILRPFRTSRNQCRLGNARREFCALRIGSHACRREKELSCPAKLAARTAESCAHRAGSGTRGDRTGAVRAGAAVVVAASQKCRTGETGCAERRLKRRAVAARFFLSTPGQRTSGDNRGPR